MALMLLLLEGNHSERSLKGKIGFPSDKAESGVLSVR